MSGEVWPDEATVDLVASVLMDDRLRPGAFAGGEEEARNAWRGHASAALAALDIPAREAAAYRAGAEAMREAAMDALFLAAWRHEGDDMFSRGMDEGARKQMAACVFAIHGATIPTPPDDATKEQRLQDALHRIATWRQP